MTAVPERDWLPHAACRTGDPDRWFPDRAGPHNGRDATAICTTCPVNIQCADDAESRDEPFGIWGGRARHSTRVGSPARRSQYEKRADERIRRADDNPGMTALQCIQCGTRWATNAGPRDNFTAITKLCPGCVAKLPVLPWGMTR